VTGIGLFVVPLLLAVPVARELEADGRAVEDIPPEELPYGWRVRYIGLIAGAGLALVPIGLVWLAFADWRLALVAMVVCFLLILTPGIVSAIRGPRRGTPGAAG